MAHALRQAVDAAGGAGKTVVLAGDGSFCNRTCVRATLDRTELIVRTRKDAVLCHRAAPGSRRFYEPTTFTPAQVRQDEARPWQVTKVCYGGKRRTIRYKDVTAVHWRLDPIPPDLAGAALGFSDLGALGEAVPFLVSLNPSALELLDASFLRLIPNAPLHAVLLLIEFERETAAAARGVVGDAVRGLKHQVVHVETALDRAGLDRLWEVRRLASPALARLPTTQRSLQVIEDGCVPLERLGEYIAGLRAAADRRGVPVAIFGHAGDGHVHVNALPDTTSSGWRAALERLFADGTDLLVRLGGVPAGEHGVGRLRAGLLERVYGAEVMALFRAVKRAYDPLSILNPGVIIPAADWTPLAALKVGEGAAPIPDDIATRLRDIERNAAWGTPKAALATPNP